jgi:hypothetical protein
MSECRVHHLSSNGANESPSAGCLAPSEQHTWVQNSLTGGSNSEKPQLAPAPCIGL